MHSLIPSNELALLLTRLGAKSSATSSPPEALCIVASIANFRHIEYAYGAPAASAIRHTLKERAGEICETEGGVATMSGDHILFVFDTLPPLKSDDAAVLHMTLVMEDILSTLCERPVEYAGTRLYLSVSTSLAAFTDEPFDIDSFGEQEHLAPPIGYAWRERFVAEMGVACKMLDSLFEDQFELEWEPIRDASANGQIRCYEGLLCHKNGGRPTRVGRTVSVLERLGLVRRLDQWVVESTIESLRRNSGVHLGCNVSAQSARIDVWWARIVETLMADPNVAARLTIEITESAPLPDIDIVRGFVKSLQALGCRVALDDVGAGHSNLKALFELGVDVVKIDAACVRYARDGAEGTTRLRHLVNLAKSCAPYVVLEGIESELDATLARAVGATGLQGYLYSRGLSSMS